MLAYNNFVFELFSLLKFTMMKEVNMYFTLSCFYIISQVGYFLQDIF